MTLVGLRGRATQTAPVTLRYLGFDIVLLDERHVTIVTPDGHRLVAGANMNVASARNVIRGYRYEQRLEQLHNAKGMSAP